MVRRRKNPRLDLARQRVNETLKRLLLSTGQWIFLCVPELGRAERHPFTISSPPSADVRTLHVKALNRGSATSKAWTDRKPHGSRSE